MHAGTPPVVFSGSLLGWAFDVRTASTHASEAVRQRLPRDLPLAQGGEVSDPTHWVIHQVGRDWVVSSRAAADGDIVRGSADAIVQAMFGAIEHAAAARTPRHVAVHAAVVELGGAALVIPGRSMSGKSSLA